MAGIAHCDNFRAEKRSMTVCDAGGFRDQHANGLASNDYSSRPFRDRGSDRGRQHDRRGQNRPRQRPDGGPQQAGNNDGTPRRSNGLDPNASVFLSPTKSSDSGSWRRKEQPRHEAQVGHQTRQSIALSPLSRWMPCLTPALNQLSHACS